MVVIYNGEDYLICSQLNPVFYFPLEILQFLYNIYFVHF